MTMMRKVLTFVLVCVALFAAYMNTASAAYVDDLWYYWSFDDGCYEFTNETNVNHTSAVVASENSAPAWDGVTYYYGTGSCHFTGDDVEVDELFDWAEPFTFCAWIKLDAVPVGDQMIVSIDEGNAAEVVWDIEASNGDMRYYDGSQSNKFGSPYVENTRWKWLCVKVNATDVYGYHNATKMARDAGVGYNGVSIDGFTIGEWDDYDGQNFDGRIDELAMWNRSLSDAEILTLYNSGAYQTPYEADGGAPAAGGGNVSVELLSPPEGDTDNAAVNDTVFVWRVNSTEKVDYCLFAANFTGSFDYSEYGTVFSYMPLDNVVAPRDMVRRIEHIPHNISVAADSKFGDAIDFNGTNSYVELDSGFLDSLTAATVVVWYNTTDTQDQYLFHYYKDTDNGFNIVLGQNGVYSYIESSPLNKEQLNCSSPACGSYAWVSPDWHSVVVTLSQAGGEHVLYFDGVEVDSRAADTLAFADMTAGATGYVGASWFNGAFYDGIGMTGNIDELVIYDEVLSAADVLALHVAGKAMYSYAANSHPSMVAAWTFDEDALDNFGGVYNGTVTSATLNETGYFGRAYTFDGTDDVITIPERAENLSAGWSLSYWARLSAGSSRTVIGYTDYDNNLLHQAGNVLRLETDTASDFIAGTHSDDGAWHHYVLSCGYKSCNMFEDGVNTTTDNVFSDDSLRWKYFGLEKDTNRFKGSLDEVQLFNVTLSPAEVTNIYRDSRYYLGAPKWVNVSTRVNSTALEGSWGWGVECVSESNATAAVNATWIVDWTAPTATLAANNWFQAVHQVIGETTAQAALLNISVADGVDVYAFELWVYNDSVRINVTNTTLGGTSQRVEKLMPTVNSSLAAGDYSVNLTVWDSHTAKEIPDFEVVKSADTLDFDGLKIEAVGALSADTEKVVDRYTFEFEYAFGGLKTFYVESDTGLDYVTTSGYDGHFVDWERKKWVDFEGVGAVMSVKKLSDTRWEVQVGGVSAVAKFSSVGGLNSQTYSYTITRSGLPVVSWVEPAGVFGVISGTNDSVVNVSVVGTYLDNVTFHLYNSSYVFVRDYVVDNAGNGTLYYDALVENLSTAYYFVNATAATSAGDEVSLAVKKLLRVGLTACDTGNVSVSMWLRDENIVGYELYGDIEVLGVARYGANGSSVVAANASGVNNMSLCVSPANATFALSAYVKYTSENGFTHRFFFINESLSNVTSTVYLYNYNYTTGVDDLKITTRDRDTYAYMTEVYAKLQRRYVSEDVYRTVQMDLTGDFGTAIFHVREQDTDYRLSFYDIYGRLLRQTDVMKFKCDVNDLCDLTVVLDEWSGVTSDVAMVTDLSYDNVTGNVTLVWSDTNAAVSSVQLVVTQETMTGTLTICDLSQTGNAGVMRCDVSGYTGVVLASVYTTASPKSAWVSAWFTLERALLGDLLTVEDSALFTAAIMVTAAGFGVASPFIGVVVSVFGLIVAYMLGLGAVTVTLVITAAVMGLIIGVLLRR